MAETNGALVAFDKAWPIPKPPPRTRFWPIRDQRRRLNDMQTRNLARRIIKMAPHLDRPEFYPQVRAWAICCFHVARINAALQEHDVINEETGEVRSSFDTLRKMLATQTLLARELGLTPLSMKDLPQMMR